MNNETMIAGTALIAAGLYDTYFGSPGWISEIFLLSGGALLIDHAYNDENLPEAIQNVTMSMVHVKGT